MEKYLFNWIPYPCTMEGNWIPVMVFYIAFQISSTAHYEILFPKTHIIYTIQHWRILFINLTTMIRKRIHLFFHRPVALAQKDWKPQQYSLLLFLLTWHFFRTASVQIKESKAPQMFCWKKEYDYEQRLKLKTWNCSAEVWLLKPDIVASPRFYFGKHGFLNSNKS